VTKEHPMMKRRSLMALPLAALAAPALAQTTPLRFAVGPFQPTAGDTRRAFAPFFAHLAQALGRPHELAVTTDWAGIAVALGSGQSDCAWMGPWGFVLARARAGAEPLATVLYQGRPTYHAIIIARPDLPITRFPEDAQGRRLADPASLVHDPWHRPAQLLPLPRWGKPCGECDFRRLGPG
jgi:phosphonate transport system substrate-binding protein